MGPESEFEEFDQEKSWTSVYQKIRSEAMLTHEFSSKDAKRAEFRGRNRYRDVNPYDHSRVRLDRSDVDYINASLVEAPEANRSYILTQGPLPNTSGHFWLMVWEQNSRAVLMLNRVIEKGQIKCDQYFPLGEESGDQDEMVFEDVQLKVRFVAESDASYFTVRTLELEDMESGEKKEILQFHYTTWPDFGVPQSPAAFLNFLIAVRRSGALDDNVGPPVIHCSAGIGRSGTFCLVDTCLVLIEKSRDLNSIDIRQVLLKMREFRMGLIQTPDQLRFSYSAIIEGARRVLSSSPDSGFGDTHGEICDFDIAGLPTLNNNMGNGTHSCTNGHRDTPPPVPPRTASVGNNPSQTANHNAGHNPGASGE